MDYDLFVRNTLNLIGNLRLFYRDKNSSRKNDVLKLSENKDFNTFNCVVQRSNDIVEFIIDKCLPNPKIDISDIQIGNIKKTESNLPKMKELIEAGIISVGSMLYNTVNPEVENALLLDDKYVEYNSEKMTLNEWGCLVTGWKSIRIYAYTAVVGEVETIHQKRLNYINQV